MSGNQAAAEPYWFLNWSSAPFRGVMKFHLIYEGKLSSGTHPKPDEARDIRDQISPQIKRLWETHHALQVLRGSAWVPGKSNKLAWAQRPPSPLYEEEEVLVETLNQLGMVNLCAPISVASRDYVPLVRKSLDLSCSLEILFLRKGDSGALVTQDGGLDNRLKVLFDALKVPNADNASKYPQSESPTYCLVQSDNMIQGLDIDTDRLLIQKTEEEKEVHLVIQVTVHVLRVGPWNICLV